jgi:excisionase family DNA binding protein
VDLLSLRQAAKELGLGEKVLRKAVLMGELPAYRPGKRTRYVKRSEVHAWVDSQRVPVWRNGRG